MTLTWVRARDEFELAVGSGTIRGTYERYMIARSHPFGPFWLRPAGIYATPHVGGTPKEFELPAAVGIEGVLGATRATSVFVAVWLLSILYLLAWLGLFGLLQRRRARLLAASPDTP